MTMTDDDQDDTARPPEPSPTVGKVSTVGQDDTTAAPEPDDPETTIVAADTVAAPELAWGDDEDDDEPDEPDRDSWIHTAGIAAGVLVIGVAAAVSVCVGL